MDTQRLCKLLTLTQSDNDGEALTAIRLANQILRKTGRNWTDLLNPTPEPTLSENERVHRIKVMFEAVLPSVTGNPLDFIKSLADYFDRYGTLSEKQFAALQRFYENLQRG